MDRRSFFASAIAAIAALPVFGTRATEAEPNITQQIDLGQSWDPWTQEVVLSDTFGQIRVSVDPGHGDDPGAMVFYEQLDGGRIHIIDSIF